MSSFCAGILYFHTMRKRKKLGKKAFIFRIVVDILAIVLFAIILIVFGLFYAYTAKTKMQNIQGKRDMVYGNYLSQVYLRTPISVAGQDMTVADLIALYDYNQSLEAKRNKSYAEIVDNGYDMLIGSIEPNPMKTAIMSITDDFVDENFNKDKCYAFGVKGNSFEYNRRSGNCPTGEGFSVYYLLRYLQYVPNETYVTYIAPVDPRDSPVVVTSVYDLERVIKMYSKNEYFTMSDYTRIVFIAMCRNPVLAVNLPGCRDRYMMALQEKFK